MKIKKLAFFIFIIFLFLPAALYSESSIFISTLYDYDYEHRFDYSTKLKMAGFGFTIRRFFSDLWGITGRVDFFIPMSEESTPEKEYQPEESYTFLYRMSASYGIIFRKFFIENSYFYAGTFFELAVEEVKRRYSGTDETHSNTGFFIPALALDIGVLIAGAQNLAFNAGLYSYWRFAYLPAHGTPFKTQEPDKFEPEYYMLGLRPYISIGITIDADD